MADVFDAKQVQELNNNISTLIKSLQGVQSSMRGIESANKSFDKISQSTKKSSEAANKYNKVTEKTKSITEKLGKVVKDLTASMNVYQVVTTGVAAAGAKYNKSLFQSSKIMGIYGLSLEKSRGNLEKMGKTVGLNEKSAAQFYSTYLKTSNGVIASTKQMTNVVSILGDTFGNTVEDIDRAMASIGRLQGMQIGIDIGYIESLNSGLVSTFDLMDKISQIQLLGGSEDDIENLLKIQKTTTDTEKGYKSLSDLIAKIGDRLDKFIAANADKIQPVIEAIAGAFMTIVDVLSRIPPTVLQGFMVFAVVGPIVKSMTSNIVEMASALKGLNGLAGLKGLGGKGMTIRNMATGATRQAGGAGALGVASGALKTFGGALATVTKTLLGPVTIAAAAMTALYMGVKTATDYITGFNKGMDKSKETLLKTGSGIKANKELDKLSKEANNTAIGLGLLAGPVGLLVGAMVKGANDLRIAHSKAINDLASFKMKSREKALGRGLSGSERESVLIDAAKSLDGIDNQLRQMPTWFGDITAPDWLQSLRENDQTKTIRSNFAKLDKMASSQGDKAVEIDLKISDLEIQKTIQKDLNNMEEVARIQDKINKLEDKRSGILQKAKAIQKVLNEGIEKQGSLSVLASKDSGSMVRNLQAQINLYKTENPLVKSQKEIMGEIIRNIKAANQRYQNQIKFLQTIEDSYKRIADVASQALNPEGVAQAYKAIRPQVEAMLNASREQLRIYDEQISRLEDFRKNTDVNALQQEKDTLQFKQSQTNDEKEKKSLQERIVLVGKMIKLRQLQARQGQARKQAEPEIKALEKDLERSMVGFKAQRAQYISGLQQDMIKAIALPFDEIEMKFAGVLENAESITQLAETQLSMARSQMGGLGVTVEMLQKTAGALVQQQDALSGKRAASLKELIKLEKEKANVSKELAQEQDPKAQEKLALKLNSLKAQEVKETIKIRKIETDIFRLDQKRLEITKEIRDGYLSAVGSQALAAGRFSKILFTREQRLADMAALDKSTFIPSLGGKATAEAAQASRKIAREQGFSRFDERKGMTLDAGPMDVMIKKMAKLMNVPLTGAENLTFEQMANRFRDRKADKVADVKPGEAGALTTPIVSAIREDSANTNKFWQMNNVLLQKLVNQGENKTTDGGVTIHVNGSVDDATLNKMIEEFKKAIKTKSKDRKIGGG